VVAPTTIKPSPAREFGAYWHAGLAELSRFSLTQARYGEAHAGGDAVLVFVTEDFRADKQVKSERPRADAIPVLKLNLLKRFTTGIYDYSMMLSVFAPSARRPAERAIKSTASIQDWCGQVYSQLNRTARGFRLRAHSYFEAEGDEDRAIEDAWLEDEIWLRLRLAPEQLPVGPLSVVPGMLSARLRHVRAEPENVVAELRRNEKGVLSYGLRFARGPRAVTIHFREAFPHDVLGFDESYPDGVGAAPRGANAPHPPRVVATSARRTHLMRDAYWLHNRPRDRPMRERLGLR
jgi:hypothetical protein